MTHDGKLKKKLKVPPEFYDLLKPFIKKYFHGRVEVFDVQRKYDGKKPMYYEQKRQLLQEDLAEHFFAEEPLDKKIGITTSSYKQGSLSFRGVFKDDTIKWFGLDIDTEAVKKVVFDKLIPEIEKDGLGYIWEHGISHEWKESYWNGEYGGGKLWLFGEAKLSTAKEYARQLFYRIGEPVLEEDRQFFDNKPRIFREVWPINKPLNKIRMPQGLHLSRYDMHPERFPLEWNGEEIDDPLKFMKAVIECVPFTEDKLKELIVPGLMKPLQSEKKQATPAALDGDFKFEPINLPLPVDNLPQKAKPMFRNCQALNTVLDWIVNDKFVEEAGEEHHVGGFYFFSYFKWIDVYHHNELPIEQQPGMQFSNWILDNFRFRDPESHQWLRRDKDHMPWVYGISCKKWQEAFNLCNGCPYRGQIKGPVELTYSKAIKKKTVGYMKATTLDIIRAEDLPAVKDRLFELLR